jgi:hypothetical protein
MNVYLNTALAEMDLSTPSQLDVSYLYFRFVCKVFDVFLYRFTKDIINLFPFNKYTHYLCTRLRAAIPTAELLIIAKH